MTVIWEYSDLTVRRFYHSIGRNMNQLSADLNHFDLQGDRVFGLIPIGGFAEECIAEQSVRLIYRSSQ